MSKRQGSTEPHVINKKSKKDKPSGFSKEEHEKLEKEANERRKIVAEELAQFDSNVGVIKKHVKDFVLDECFFEPNDVGAEEGRIYFKSDYTINLNNLKYHFVLVSDSFMHTSGSFIECNSIIPLNEKFKADKKKYEDD